MSNEDKLAADIIDQVGAAPFETQAEQPAEISTQSGGNQAMTAAGIEEEADECMMPDSFLSPDKIRKATLELAGQIYCARAGEPVGNRSYDWTDAYVDAACVVTISVSEAKSRELFQLAANRLGLRNPLE